MSDLYRIPVDEPNYSKLLASPLTLADVTTPVPPALRNRDHVRFWSVRSGPDNERLYQQLAPDDGLLFYLGQAYRESDDGAYVGIGRVGKKVQSSADFARESLGNEDAWRLYTVTEFQSISASPADIESVLGYTGHPQGPHRVRDDRYASVETVFETLSDTEPATSPSPNDLDTIIANAQNGRGPCEGCVAHTSGNSRLVNPGLSNYSGELMFVTEEPKHAVTWDDEEEWAEWNKRFMRGFDSAPGGEYIKTLLQPLEISMTEVWIADSLKCPTEAHTELETVDVDTAAAYEHCQQYLERELREVDPRLIVTLGNKASQRVLSLLGERVSIHTKKSDYGRVFDTQPPVVVSPHWSAYNWMSTEDTEQRVGTVQSAIEDVHDSRDLDS